MVNMKKGFWQVKLHPDSQMYRAMSLLNGRCVWTRLSMGLVVTRDEFQKKLDAVYNGKPGVTGITDDMMMTGRTEEEHDCHFLNFLQITRSKNLRLNGEKPQFKLKEVSFFGHRWCRDGLSPDSKKIKQILQMQMPEDKEAMKSFLGMINFLGRFFSKFSELSVPLRKISDVRGLYQPSSQAVQFPSDLG